MNDSQKKKDCLIIIPQAQKDSSEEPDWANIAETENIAMFDSNGMDNAGCLVSDAITGLDTYVLFTDPDIYDNVKVVDENKLRNLVEKLNKNYFKNKDINLNSYKNIVLCGHFHCSMQSMRKYWNELEKMDVLGNSGMDKTIVANFKDPIKQKGNFIFERYTLGGNKNRLTEIIQEIKEPKTSKTLTSIFSQMFNYCWAGHLVEIIQNLVTQLFILLHSDGKCETPEKIKDSIEKLSAEHNIVNDTFFEKSKLSSVWNLENVAQAKDSESLLLDELKQQREQVFNALSEAAETVLIKRAGKVS